MIYQVCKTNHKVSNINKKIPFWGSQLDGIFGLFCFYPNPTKQKRIQQNGGSIESQNCNKLKKVWNIYLYTKKYRCTHRWYWKLWKKQSKFGLYSRPCLQFYETYGVLSFILFMAGELWVSTDFWRQNITVTHCQLGDVSLILTQ